MEGHSHQDRSVLVDKFGKSEVATKNSKATYGGILITFGANPYSLFVWCLTV